MLRFALAVVLGFWSICLFDQPAFAEKRVALAIGNSAYQRVARLSNPANDAEAVATMLKAAAFDVVEVKTDLGVSDMRRALREFADRVRGADVALVYYAGHGIEVNGVNYLVPIDAVLERDIDAFDEAIPLDRVLMVIEPARKLRLVILDACRDNPFVASIKQITASRSIGRGLAKIEPASPNTLIAFAAKAGSTATDGDNGNSPFTAALLRHLPKPGLDLRKAFGFVRDDVLEATYSRQEPFIYGSLGGEDVPLVPAPPAPPPVPNPPPDPNVAARLDYELALQINMLSVWDSYIRNHPSGFFTDLAIVQRDKLKAEQAEQVPIVPEKKTQEDAKAAAAKATDSKAQEIGRIAAAIVGDGFKQIKDDQPRVPASPACPAAASPLAPSASRKPEPLSSSEECALEAKNIFKECENCPDMVVVPAGEALIGSSRSDIENGIAAANEGPQHKALISAPIAVGRFEVTRDQYAAFIERSGYKAGDHCFTFENNLPKDRTERSFLNPGYVQDGSHPAVCVSWADAVAYTEWLSKTTGKVYRLLTEAEYEYAARGGNSSRYGFGNDPAELCKHANGADQSAKSAGLPADAPYLGCNDSFPFTSPAGSLAANAFGLHDLIGNVWEWTEDCFYNDYASARHDAAARSDAGCSHHAVRGGDWFSTETSLRPAARAKAEFDARHDDIGFRVARTIGR